MLASTRLPKELCKLVIEYLDDRPSNLHCSSQDLKDEDGKIVVPQLPDRKENKSLWVPPVKLPSGQLVGYKLGNGYHNIIISYNNEHTLVIEGSILLMDHQHHLTYRASNGEYKSMDVHKALYKLIMTQWSKMFICRSTLYGCIRTTRSTSVESDASKRESMRELIPLLRVGDDSVPVSLPLERCFDDDGNCLLIDNSCVAVDHHENRIYFIEEYPHRSEYFEIDDTRHSFPMTSLPPFAPMLSKKLKKKMQKKAKQMSIPPVLNAKNSNKVFGTTVCKGIVTVLRDRRLDRFDPLTNRWSTQLIVNTFDPFDSHLLV